MFDIAGTVELGTICPGTGTWNRLQDGIIRVAGHIVPEYLYYRSNHAYSTCVIHPYKRGHLPYMCFCPAF